MEPLDRRLAAIAASQRNLLTRPQVLAAGGSDTHIESRLARGQWRLVHPGVICTAAAPLDWHGRLLAGSLAAGPAAFVTARAGLLLYGLDAIKAAPVEISVPFTSGPVTSGVIVHRSRRPSPINVRHGIPVAAIERVLLDAAAFVPPVVLEKALHSATRTGLTSPEKVLAFVDQTGARGVKGAALLRQVVAEFGPGRPARSGGEVVLGRILRELQQYGIEPPIRNYPLPLPDGSEAVLDFAWPVPRVGAEFDGIDGHSSIRDVDFDDHRQNQILDLQWQLRRFGWPTASRRPQIVVRTLAPLLLCGSTRAQAV